MKEDIYYEDFDEDIDLGTNQDKMQEDCEQFLVDYENIGKRLDVFLSEITQNSRSMIKNLIEQKNVVVNNKTVKSGYMLKQNDIIDIIIPQQATISLAPQNIPLDIVYEDNDLIVINKVQGMVVHPAVGAYDGTLVNALLYHCQDLSTINGVNRPGIVHRLDKDTSGLLVIAKNDKTHMDLQQQISQKTALRHYMALVDGVVKKDEGVIETYISRWAKDRKLMCVPRNNIGRIAITHWKVVHRYTAYTLMEYELKTGRTHQIRVHSKHIGHSVVGDVAYGGSNKFGLNGQLLHAFRLEFTHPTTQKRMVFTSNLPEYFQKVLSGLKTLS